MQDQFDELNNDDALKAENDFIKMKLMLEKGAQFNTVSNECTPEMENEFLNYIMEFEKQAENPTYIKVFDKIERPAHFKPVSEIADDDIEKALEELLDYLLKYQIDLSVCSPNISARELYRFIVEELFEHEMDDMSIPGMTHGFIYDEFHPDPVYDNARMVVDECISQILSKRELHYMFFYRSEELQLNDHFPLSHEDFKKRIQLFKDSFDEINELRVDEVKCHVEGKYSFVKGTYEFIGKVGIENLDYSGRWLVNLEWNEESFDWEIYSVNIEGINF